MEKIGQNNGRTGEAIRVKADESMKTLFSLSKRPTLDLINGLFNENFTMDDAEIVYKNTEFISSDV